MGWPQPVLRRDQRETRRRIQHMRQTLAAAGKAIELMVEIGTKAREDSYG